MKVFITRVIPEKGLQLLKDAGCTITQYLEKKNLPQPELIAVCKNYDALLSVGPNIIDEYFLKECGHLKALSLFSVGYDNVDIKAANKLKIPIGNTPGVVSVATADMAFLLMLAVSRNAFYINNLIKKGDWAFYEPTANLGIELEGKVLGIFGLGRIGMELAKKCMNAYGMKIIYCNRSHNETAEHELNATRVSFDELLQQSDVLSVNTSLSPETKGIFNKNAFEKMKPSAIFINTARGGIHNELDLIEALNNKIIWGAGLDVTNPEPMAKDNPLLTMPKVCVLPHIATATVETRNAMAEIAAKNIIAGLKGERMPFAINPEVYE